MSPVFDDEGTLIYFFASLHNKTPERLAQMALRQKSLEFEALADNVSQLAWMAEPNGHIYWFNRRWYEYTGTNLETMLGWGWRDVLLPDQTERIVSEVGGRWTAGKAWEGVYYLSSASGEYRPFLTRAEPIRDAAGELIRWCGTNTDISAQHESEQRLRELNDTLEQRVVATLVERVKVEDQLRQSQKLEAVGELTGGVAHDFNNLLTVIRSSIDLLMRPNLPEERRARYMAAISDTVDRAAKLTGQLLAFARRQALKPEVFDPNQSVRDLGDMVGTLTGTRISVSLGLAASPCYVSADPSQFDTALVNMAVNARDAMEGCGQITIAVRSVEGIPLVRSHPACEGKFVAVSITDTGTGIAADDLERIFEPFFTTKGVGHGTGLGLSQVFGFAKQSGGEVAVESIVGEGTTFTLFLPEVDAPERPAGKPRPEALMDGHGTCVLVVEDNLGVGTFATQTLAELGYGTVWAASAEEALVELAENADRFDVVFSDVVMPGMNGIELAKRIRRDHDDLPVVLTSGYSDVLAQTGTDGFELLHKPYSLEQLSRVLRSVVTPQRRKRILGK